MDNLSSSIQSFIIGLAISNLCTTFVDAIMTPLLMLFFNLFSINLDNYNSSSVKIGEFVKSIISFIFIFAVVKYLSVREQKKKKINKKPSTD